MFDGVFTKYLVNELKQIENVRINKFGSITESEFYLSLSTKNKLLISINSNNMHIRLTSMEITSNNKITNFHNTLKKYLESSIISEISQYQNDRIVIITLNHYDDLGYLIPVDLIIELFGRNSNIVLVNKSNNQIIDCYKRCFDDNSSVRIILPKSVYSFPTQENIQINPFSLAKDLKQGENSYFNNNNFQGVSTLLFNQLQFDNSLERLYSEPSPILIKNTNNKYIFYCFDLPYIEGVRKSFSSLSELLDYYYITLKKDESQNLEQLYLTNHIKHEITKINHKISKQKNELHQAEENLVYEKIGNLLSCNLHKIKKGDELIIVENFYDNNEPIEIKLNPLLYPNENLKQFFNKYQKAKRAIKQIEQQILLSTKDLEYYECLLYQVNISRVNDLIEIYNELNLKTKTTLKAKKSRPNITIYLTFNRDTIWVGKNNIQNNYLTNEMARNTDYFFHVQNVPGSHVIVRTENLTEELIYLAGCIAAYYSSYRYATNVCIDYTLIKNVRKIPGVKGSFVTYTKFKSVFVKPDLEFINNNTSKA